MLVNTAQSIRRRPEAQAEGDEPDMFVVPQKPVSFNASGQAQEINDAGHLVTYTQHDPMDGDGPDGDEDEADREGDEDTGANAGYPLLEGLGEGDEDLL
jgi:hypothetical protein